LTKLKKANAKVNALVEACKKLHDSYAAEGAKLDKKWQPRIAKANKAEADAAEESCKLSAQCKELRKSFISQDNPNRQELLDLILKD
jgi:hypothetical protein